MRARGAVAGAVSRGAFGARVALLAALSGLAAAPAHAAAQDATPNLWDVRVEFGLNGASGNSSFSILQGGFAAKRVRTDRYELEFTSSVRYGKNDEKVIADDAGASVKFDWKPDERFSPFVYADVGRDAIRRLDLQLNGGAGAKYTFHETERSDLSLSAAAILDYQNFQLPEGATAPGSETNARYSLRLKGTTTLEGGTELSQVTFWKPVVNDLGDYQIEATTSVSTTLIRSLSLVVKHVYLRDSVPPPGAGPDDQKYSVLLRLVL